jgi:hypothetical protein
MSRPNVVWLSPSATSFSCLCEPCLDAARESSLPFAEALAFARVTGSLAPEVEFLGIACAHGHELLLRRAARPPLLPARDPRQLQLV